MDISKKNVLWYVLLGILGIMVVCCLYYTTFVRAILSDEQEHTYASFMIYRGFSPYKDFFEHHHPLMWYLFYPLMFLFHNDASIFIVERCFSLWFLFCDCFFLIKICRLISQEVKFQIITILFFLLPECVMLYGVDFRPDNVMLMFCLAGIYYWFCFIQFGGQAKLNLAFLYFFLSLMTLQKVLLMLLPVGVVCLKLLWDRRLGWQTLVKALLCPFMLAGVYIFYLYICGTLKDYFELNWLLNLKQKFDFTSSIWQTKYCLIALFLALYGVFFVQNEILRIVSFLCLATFSLLQFVVYTPWLQYWILVYPYFAIITAYWLMKLKYSFLRLGVMAVIVCFAGVHCWKIIQMVRSVDEKLSDSVTRVAQVLRRTGEDDFILSTSLFISGLRFEASGYYWFERGYTARIDYHFFQRREWPNIDYIVRTTKPKVIANESQGVCISDNLVYSLEACHGEEVFNRSEILENYYDYGDFYLRKKHVRY